MKCSLRTAHALWWLEGVGVSVPLHSRTHALLSDHTHTHTHFKRSDDAQDVHGPSKQTLLDNFIRTSQSIYPPKYHLLSCERHTSSFLPWESNCCRVCVTRSWMKERSPCGLLPSDPLLSMKQEIMAEGPRCKRRKQANPRRKNGKKVSYVEKRVSGLFSLLQNTVGFGWNCALSTEALYRRVRKTQRQSKLFCSVLEVAIKPSDLSCFPCRGNV